MYSNHIIVFILLYSYLLPNLISTTIQKSKHTGKVNAIQSELEEVKNK